MEIVSMDDDVRENESVYALIQGKSDAEPRLTLLDSGTELFACDGCQVKRRYEPPENDTVIKLACSFECAQKIGLSKISGLRLVTEEPGEEESEKKSEPCPVCQGLPLGRGWRHTTECPKSTANRNKQKRGFCPNCNGLSSGRGYKHNDGCPRIAGCPKIQREPCKVCGGPPRGRGHHHGDDCSLATGTNKPKGPRTKQSLTCPLCKGLKKGKGYNHIKSCKKASKRCMVNV